MSEPPDSTLAVATLDLSPLSEHLVFAIHRADLALRRDFMMHMDDVQVRPMAFSALVLLGANPGIAQARLAGALMIDKGTAAHLVGDLERRGWVESSSRIDDRRRKDIFLSPLGVQVLDRINIAVQLHAQRIQALLTTDERQLLLRLLHRVGSMTQQPTTRASAPE